MINKNIEGAVNRQINAELYSEYLYLSMASYFESVNLRGFAKWMEAQAVEEQNHAMKFYSYINERGGRVIFDSIAKPPSKWDSPLAVFEETYKHEQKVTAMINDLTDLARAEKDNATEILLQWYVNEQVEEEASASEILEKLKIIGSSGNGLIMLDRELGQRKTD
ncbi:MAG: ferritin [Spirochaetales bacterium]|nr:ferritin [Spirochaetales bacterium]